MVYTPIQTLDLNFQGKPLAVASYMLEHSSGVVLIETGPGSTLTFLEAGLKARGFGLQDVTHVLLTHIHLDHAGAAGRLANLGAQIYVHPVGAPHLLNPEKLLGSAARIYGDRMDSLWGEFLAVPPEKLTVLNDNEELVVGQLRFRAIDTPGHAEHHFCYQFEDLCFSGDVGGVRIPGYLYLRVPMPPPEFHLEKWRDTVQKVRMEHFKRIAPTHYGIFDDVNWHLDAVESTLNEVENWLTMSMPQNLSIDELKVSFSAWMDEQSVRMGLDPRVVEAYALSNPVGMSVDGLARYWKKYRA